MQVVASLLSAIVRHDGDSLVMHVGEQPVVMTASGPVPLTGAKLTLASMDDLLRELLPPAAHQALDEYGAVDVELPPAPALPGERFTVVAARGGDDIWIELRRERAGASQPAPAGSSDLERALAQASEVPADVPGSVSPRAPRAGRPAGSRNVLPLARTPLRTGDGNAAAPRATRPGGLDRLLRLAAARGAESLFLFSQARPSIRVDGEIAPLENEPVLAQDDVEALLVEVLPDRRDPQEAPSAERIVDIPDVGRVRCTGFVDHRGPGAMFRMIPAKVPSAEQLGLSREIQQLAAEPQGLVIVAGPRASGKSTLLAAFVDLVNRTRSDHVITLESRIEVVHEARGSLVSQREVRGDAEALLAALRAAIRENPDVIVIEDLRSAEVAAAAMEAAASGHLVIAGVPAHSAALAIERLVEAHPPERRPYIQGLLADTLRGVVVQVLLRKAGGGRVAARELLLGSPSIAKLVAEGRLGQLNAALESGRRVGMVPLADALVAFVQSGAVEVREAWRKAADRPGLLKVLKREGIDTSFAERLA